MVGLGKFKYIMAIRLVDWLARGSVKVEVCGNRWSPYVQVIVYYGD